MKRLALFLLLSVSVLSLSSFGIISNPRLAEQNSSEIKTLTINSKSTIISKSQAVTSLDLKEEPDLEKQETESKNFIKSFFSFVISALSQIVWTLLSK